MAAFAGAYPARGVLAEVERWLVGSPGRPPSVSTARRPSAVGEGTRTVGPGDSDTLLGFQGTGVVPSDAAASGRRSYRPRWWASGDGTAGCPCEACELNSGREHLWSMSRCADGR